MNINYDEISKKYDDVRSESKNVVDLFLEEISITPETKILDFGCGTGNYANMLQRLTGGQLSGVEPSDGMREKAKEKNSDINFVKGDHENIPFEDNYFDFTYMTDVIHHVPDLDMMFAEIKRVLKAKGKLCIVTESHAQIDGRFYVKYFPSTAKSDKKRYPDIDEIIEKAKNNGFTLIKSITNGDGTKIEVKADFVELVRNKGYSMFHLIPEDEYEIGLKQLEKDVMGGKLEMETSGDTLVWLKKNY